MSISITNSHHPLGAASLPITKRREGVSPIARRVLQQPPVDAPLRITRSVASQIAELKQIPFFENLNGKELEKVYRYMLRDKGSLERYTNNIKAGHWNEVVTIGMDASDVDFILMAAHALKKVTLEEMATAWMFIDFALESKELGKQYTITEYETTAYYNRFIKDELLSISDLEHIPSNLRFSIKDVHSVGLYSLPISYMQQIRIVRNHSFTRALTYKMPNVLKCIDHFFEKRSPMAFKKPGTTSIIHGCKASAWLYYDHDDRHLRQRLEAFGKDEDNFRFACRNLTVLKEYLQKIAPYSQGVRPRAVLDENLWVLPGNATGADRMRHVMEQVAILLTEIGYEIETISFESRNLLKYPHSLYKRIFYVDDDFKELLTEKEKLIVLRGLKALYKEEWKHLF